MHGSHSHPATTPMFVLFLKKSIGRYADAEAYGRLLVAVGQARAADPVARHEAFVAPGLAGVSDFAFLEPLDGGQEGEKKKEKQKKKEKIISKNARGF